MGNLTDEEIRLLLKYLTAIRILFVIAKKGHKELDGIIKKIKGVKLC